MKEFKDTVLGMTAITVIVFAGMLLFTAALPYVFELIQTSTIGMATMIPVGIVVGAVFSFFLMKLAGVASATLLVKFLKRTQSRRFSPSAVLPHPASVITSS